MMYRYSAFSTSEPLKWFHMQTVKTSPGYLAGSNTPHRRRLVIEFGEYMTPQQYVDEFGEAFDLTVEELQRLAEQPETTCTQCEIAPAWKLANTGLCFRCETGSSDASGDIEIVTPEDERLTGDD